MKNENHPRSTLWHEDIVRLVVIGGACLVLVGCGFQLFTKDSARDDVTGGAVSGIMAVESLVNHAGVPVQSRNAALIGIRVSEYLARAVVTPVKSALEGIRIQSVIARTPTGEHTDFALLQELENALSVNVGEMLNRSANRLVALDQHVASLVEVGKKAEERQQLLESAEKEQDTVVRDARKKRTVISRELNAAIDEKNFSLASEKQEALNASEKEVVEAEAKLNETRTVLSTLEDLLSLLSERVLAIQKNREILIAGLKAVDVPGAEEIEAIEKEQGTRRTSTTRRGGSTGESPFTKFYREINGL